MPGGQPAAVGRASRLAGRPGWAEAPWRLAPAAVALVASAVFLIAAPRPGDLAVHVFGFELFGSEGIERLASAHFGGGAARYGSLWFGLGTVTLLATARLPFALGVALGLGALLALRRERLRAGAVLALPCPLASPSGDSAAFGETGP
jgi:hypothetical protein